MVARGSKVVLFFLYPSHPLATPLGGFGLFLFFLYAGLVIKTPFLDFRKEAFFCQFSLKVSDGLFYLVVMDNDFHVLSTS